MKGGFVTTYRHIHIHVRSQRIQSLKHNTNNKHYRTGLVCRVSNTLGKGPFALGKGFAECGTRQTALGKKSDGEGTFAECLFSDTRQRLCRVPEKKHSAKMVSPSLFLPCLICRVPHSANPLPSAKGSLPSVFGTRQSTRV